jgi:regulatory protein
MCSGLVLLQMTIESVKLGASSNLYRVGLSDGSLIYCQTDYIAPGLDSNEVLIIGRVLKPFEADALRHSSACYRAEKAALNLVTRAEQSAAGLSRKLLKKGHAADCVQAVLARLIDTGLVSDERYAQAWLRGRINRGDSPRNMREGLRRRGIDAKTVDTALEAALDADAEEALLEKRLKVLAAKKRPKSRPSLQAWNEQALRKILRHEGFSSELINRFNEEGRLD